MSVFGRIGAGLDFVVAVLGRFGLGEDFCRFGIVGTLGFCWDTTTVYGLRHATGLYVAGTAGFVVAASANWALNRAWTFRRQQHEQAHRQWAKFMAANLIGFIFNRGAFFLLVSSSALCRKEPVLAIIAGSAAGLIFNYFLSKKYVFR